MQGYKTNHTENEYDDLEQLVDLIGQSTSMYVKAAFEQGFVHAVNSSLRSYAIREYLSIHKSAGYAQQLKNPPLQHQQSTGMEKGILRLYRIFYSTCALNTHVLI